MRRPEEFVRWCVSFLPDTRPVVEVPRSPADWNRVFAIATRHGVLPFLYGPVSHLEGHAVPDAVLQALRQLCILIQVRNQQALRTCQSLLAALRLAGISPLMLKGVALPATVYRETPQLRSFVDIDALIREPDFPQAHAVLTRLGYQAEHESLHNPEEVYHWPKYRRPDDLLAIELHYGLVKADTPFQIPLRELWDRARSVEADGQEMLVCAPEDMMLHGALH
ncbi:MAG: nucleotidyltransferase domain-containing protein, partial [Acidimicrobiia bacterium]